MDGDIQVGIVMCSLYVFVENKENGAIKQAIDEMFECQEGWHREEGL